MNIDRIPDGNQYAIEQLEKSNREIAAAVEELAAQLVEIYMQLPKVSPNVEVKISHEKLKGLALRYASSGVVSINVITLLRKRNWSVWHVSGAYLVAPNML